MFKIYENKYYVWSLYTIHAIHILLNQYLLHHVINYILNVKYIDYIYIYIYILIYLL